MLHHSFIVPLAILPILLCQWRFFSFTSWLPLADLPSYFRVARPSLQDLEKADALKPDSWLLPRAIGVWTIVGLLVVY